jgi:hypothetical protein
MFERILVIDIFVALLLPVAWGIAGYLAGRLAFRPTRGRLLVSVSITLAVLGLAGLLVVAKMVMIQQFWSYGETSPQCLGRIGRPKASRTCRRNRWLFGTRPCLTRGCCCVIQ